MSEFYTQTNAVQYYMTFTFGFIQVNYLIKMNYLYTKTMPWACNESGSAFQKCLSHDLINDISYKNATAITSVVQHLQLL